MGGSVRRPKVSPPCILVWCTRFLDMSSLHSNETGAPISAFSTTEDAHRTVHGVDSTSRALPCPLPISKVVVGELQNVLASMRQNARWSDPSRSVRTVLNVDVSVSNSQYFSNRICCLRLSLHSCFSRVSNFSLISVSPFAEQGRSFSIYYADAAQESNRQRNFSCVFLPIVLLIPSSCF